LPPQALAQNGLTYYNIVNVASGLVLDVPGGTSASGTQIQQWVSNGFNQQSWRLAPVAGTAYFNIVNFATGSVLDVPSASTADGVTIQQWTPNGYQQQNWQLVPVTSTPYFSIVNVATGKALDIPGGATSNGVHLQQFTPNGSAEQLWTLSPATYYKIVNAATGSSLDVPNGSTVSGTVVQEWVPNGLPQQNWAFAPIGGTSTFNIVNFASGMVLDVLGDSSASGTQIQQQPANGLPEQIWRLSPVNGTPYFNIVNIGTGAVLDVPSASTANGTVIQQWAANGYAQQNWQLANAPAWPSVKVDNLTHPHMWPNFAAGDVFQITVIGPPNQPVYLSRAVNGSPSTVLIGQTASNGFLQINGTESASQSGTYTDVYSVSSQQAKPTLSYVVAQLGGPGFVATGESAATPDGHISGFSYLSISNSTSIYTYSSTYLDAAASAYYDTQTVATLYHDGQPVQHGIATGSSSAAGSLSGSVPKNRFPQCCSPSSTTDCSSSPRALRSNISRRRWPCWRCPSF